MNTLAVDALLHEVAGNNQEWLDHINQETGDEAISNSGYIPALSKV